MSRPLVIDATSISNEFAEIAKYVLLLTTEGFLFFYYADITTFDSKYVIEVLILDTTHLATRIWLRLVLKQTRKFTKLVFAHLLFIMKITTYQNKNSLIKNITKNEGFI